MLQEGDPFQQAASDLELLLQRSKSIQNRVSTSGFVSSQNFEEFGEIYNEAVDLLDILKEALQVLNDMGGKINGKVFSANEVVQRQNTVRGFENDIDNLKKFYTSLSARQEAVNANIPTQEETTDNYVLLQQRAQQEEIAQQEEVMERMAHGLQELRETGLNINNELETQNTILVDVDRNMSTVQARLRSANEKLDQLLASLSNKDARISDESPLCETSLLSVLRFSCPGTPPRFLVGLGTNDKIVRSADKGDTWKEMEIPQINGGKEAYEEQQELDDTASSSPTTLGKTSSAGKSNPKQSGTLSHLSCFEDTVVAGGKNGHLFISVDRGIHFSELDVLEHYWESGVRVIQGLCVLDRHNVCVSNGKVVLSVQFSRHGEPPEAQCDAVRNLYSAENQDNGICWIGCLSFSSTCRELIISEPGILSISWDMGKHFTSFRHNLGSIRCCDNLKALRNSQLPPFPSSSRVILSLLKKEEKTSETLQYEYSRGTHLPYFGRKMEKLIKNHQLVFPYTESDGYSSSPLSAPQVGTTISYRYYYVTGIGTAVLPYDYSALLCVGLVHSRDGNTKVPRIGLFTVADKVQYVPYAKSSPQEPLLCATARALPSETGIVVPGGDTIFAVRGNNTAGVTVSKDFTKWDTPKTTGPVALISSDGGEMIVCIQRNVVLHLGPTDTMGSGLGGRAIVVRTKFPIPKDMHIPSLSAMGAC